eukprot:323496_1
MGSDVSASSTGKLITVENDKKIKVYKQRSGECKICREDTELINISPGCKHNPDYCRECIKRTIETKISSKGNRQFQCMYPRCDTEFDSSQYYALLDKKHLCIVDKLNLNAILEIMPEFRWCKNPKGCGSGQLVSNWKGLQGYYSCHACEQEMCFKHNMAWHMGYDCKEFETEMENNPDLASDKLILQFSKKCPKCATTIIKLEGCDVMKCCRFGTHGCHDAMKKFGKCDHGGQQYCGQLFCWCCLGKIEIDEKHQGRYIRHCKEQCQYADLNN